jgi:hypothetical protein
MGIVTGMKRLAFSLVALYIIAVFGLSVYFLAATQLVAAQTPSPVTPVVIAADEAQSDPTKVKVGVYILNLGKLDTSNGSFTADFYMSFDSDKASDPSKFEFFNGRATSVDKSVDEPASKFYRIQASLADTLNLSRYPFDRHTLTIELEDKEQTINSQVYEVSMKDSGLDPAVKLSGWDITGWNAHVEDHYYVPYDTTFSKYVFEIQIQRSDLAAILKTILPAFIIVVVGLLSLALSPDKIIPRLTLTTGAFTSAVLFHLNMTSSLPPLGYLTLGDRFMIFNYLALTLALISTLVALYFVDRKRTDSANRVHTLALFLVPILWAGLQLLNFFVF